MAEPRHLIIDTETGRRVEITTDELQALVWRMELQQPLDGAYFESKTERTASETIHRHKDRQHDPDEPVRIQYFPRMGASG